MRRRRERSRAGRLSRRLSGSRRSPAAPYASRSRRRGRRGTSPPRRREGRLPGPAVADGRGWRRGRRGGGGRPGGGGPRRPAGGRGGGRSSRGPRVGSGPSRRGRRALRGPGAARRRGGHRSRPESRLEGRAGVRDDGAHAWEGHTGHPWRAEDRRHREEEVGGHHDTEGSTDQAGPAGPYTLHVEEDGTGDGHRPAHGVHRMGPPGTAQPKSFSIVSTSSDRLISPVRVARSWPEGDTNTVLGMPLSP